MSAVHFALKPNSCVQRYLGPPTANIDHHHCLADIGDLAMSGSPGARRESPCRPPACGGRGGPSVELPARAVKRLS